MVENKNNRGSDSEPPTVSIIVPAFNSEVTIGRCLRALHNQTYPQDRYEIIVVDDASTDKTAEIASKAGVLVVAEGKLGKSGVRNLGAQRATGEIILFTDSDCEPIPNWIELMVAPFIEVDVAGVKGAYWSQQTDLVARFTQIEVEERYRRMAQQESINFIDTYAAGYRRDIKWFLFPRRVFSSAHDICRTLRQAKIFNWHMETIITKPLPRTIYIRFAHTSIAKDSNGPGIIDDWTCGSCSVFATCPPVANLYNIIFFSGMSTIS
jgi:glycosyltransferase involved in cell wall biosynthesis